MFLKFFGKIIGRSGPTEYQSWKRCHITRGWMHHFSPVWLASAAPCWQREQSAPSSLHDQKTVIRVSLGSMIQTSKHSKSTIRGRFFNRSVIRRFCKIHKSIQVFNKIHESDTILGQICRSASLFIPPLYDKLSYLRDLPFQERGCWLVLKKEMSATRNEK